MKSKTIEQLCSTFISWSKKKVSERIRFDLSNNPCSMFDFSTDFEWLNHRMHHQIMVMDNTLAIIGGRNIGDHYFVINPQSNFRDLDVIAAISEQAMRQVAPGDTAAKLGQMAAGLCKVLILRLCPAA